MTFTFGGFFSDLKSSRYAQIWTFLWFVSAIVMIVSLVHFSVRAANSAEGDAYKMVYERHSRMRWPEFRLEVANGTHTTIGSVVCTTPNPDKTPGKPIKLVPCLKGNHLPNTCLQSVDASENEATAETDLINCVIVEIAGQDANKVLTVSFVENRDNSSWNRAYVQPNDQIDIFIKKEEFTPISGNGFTRWDSVWAYVDSRRDDNAMIINFKIDSFGNRHWYAYESGLTGFQVFAQFFGFCFGMYVLHSFVMLFVGIVFTNDAKSLGGGAGSYSPM